MPHIPFSRDQLAVFGVTAAFVLFGLYLFFQPVSPVLPLEEQLIYDLIWLDAWSVAFLVTLAVIWAVRFPGKQKAVLGIALLGIYGAVEIAMIFHGTPFCLNAYWGDQKFRQAMLTKFLGWMLGSDFYYRDLTSFYPPAWYLFLTGIGRAFSFQAWELMKVGSILIYLCWPAVLYLFWRRLVTSVQAWGIVLFTMLITSHSLPYVLAAPHAFLANTLFIPWWLIYIERVPESPMSIRRVLAGGLIGALLFTTYFYPFFIAAFLLLLRLTVLRSWQWFSRPTRFSWISAMAVLGSAAVLAAPYWLPVLVDIARFGSDRSRGGWHHVGSPGLNLPFLEVTIPALLFLAGIWYVARRPRTPLNRGLLTLFGSAILFLLAGSVLGALDMSINLVKARDWLLVFGGPMIGLPAAGLLRRGRRSVRPYVVPVLIGLLLLAFLHPFNQSLRHPMVKTARVTEVPTFGIDESTAQARKGAVYLSGVEEFFSFYPVYSFIAANEHYSHPASRFKQRLDLLALLHDLADPGVFALALCNNRYDTVDYVMPLVRNNELEFIVSMSNYPNAHHTCTFGFPTTFFADQSLFEPVTGQTTYRLHEPSAERHQPPLRRYADTVTVALIAGHLTESGRAKLAAYTGVAVDRFEPLMSPSETRLHGDALDLVGAVAMRTGDSLQLSFAYRPFRRFPDSCRVYVHVNGNSGFHNFDFDPPRPVATWSIDSLVVLQRMIPVVDFSMQIFFGMYTAEGALDGGLVAEYSK